MQVTGKPYLLPRLASLVLVGLFAYVVLDRLLGPRVGLVVLSIYLALLAVAVGIGWLGGRRTARSSPSRAELGLSASLDELVPDGFAVLHGVHLGDEVLPHVVVGPPGVFVVGLASGAGPAEVAAELSAATERLARRMRTEISAVLAVSDDGPAERVTGVTVVQASAITEWFRRRRGGWDSVRPEVVQATVLELFRVANRQAEQEEGDRRDTA